MKFVSLPPAEIIETQQTSVWFHMVYKGAFQNLRSETLSLNMRAEPSNPNDGNSILWMANEDKDPLYKKDDICIKINIDGVIKTGVVIEYASL